MQETNLAQTHGRLLNYLVFVNRYLGSDALYERNSRGVVRSHSPAHAQLILMAFVS